MVDGKKRHRISLVDCQPFQRFEENFGRVQREFFLGPVWPDDELCRRATTHIALKNFIGIVEVGNDQREAGEVSGQTFVKLAIASEEARQRARFD